MFSWDHVKNASNQRKHGVSFEAAQWVFDDPAHLSRQDRIENGEPRWQTLGKVGETVLLLVVHTWNDDEGGEHIRIISARRATLSERTSMNKVPESIRKELAALAAQPDRTIDFSDIPATTADDWQAAVRGKFYRPVKQQLTVRIDADVIDWLKQQGAGYQSRLNTILRDAMLNAPHHP